MAATERVQRRRRQCVFRLATQYCPFRKLARKIRGKNAYNVPAEPTVNLSDQWHSFSTISGNFPSPEGRVFSQMALPPPHPFPQVSMQPLPLGPQPMGFSPQQVQVELNREPSLSSMEMEVDPETGERA